MQSAPKYIVLFCASIISIGAIIGPAESKPLSDTGCYDNRFGACDVYNNPMIAPTKGKKSATTKAEKSLAQDIAQTRMCKDGGYVCTYNDSIGVTPTKSTRSNVAVNHDAANQYSDLSPGSRRPAGCPSKWCGCWLAMKMGYGVKDTKLWVARNWSRVGTALNGPAVGAVVVLSRGKAGGHVGVIQEITNSGDLIILSGNDNNRVGIRMVSKKRVLAYRSI